jgi:hypothetical protein
MSSPRTRSTWPRRSRASPPRFAGRNRSRHMPNEGPALRFPNSFSLHFSHAHLNGSLESLATPFVESPSPPAVSCGGRRCRRRMREALYEICAIYRHWSESARRRANDVRVKRPLIRLRHLLPQLKSAGGEGLSIGGTAENEPLAQLHIAQNVATNRVPAIPLSM